MSRGSKHKDQSRARISAGMKRAYAERRFNFPPSIWDDPKLCEAVAAGRRRGRTHSAIARDLELTTNQVLCHAWRQRKSAVHSKTGTGT